MNYNYQFTAPPVHLSYPNGVQQPNVLYQSQGYQPQYNFSCTTPNNFPHCQPAMQRSQNDVMGPAMGCYSSRYGAIQSQDLPHNDYPGYSGHTVAHSGSHTSFHNKIPASINQQYPQQSSPVVSRTMLSNSRISTNKSVSSNPEFEKAVINAAISVAQQREAAGVYKPAKRPNYAPQAKKSSGDNSMHYCDVCKVSCGGAQTYQSHIAGKQHKKKASQVVAAASSSSETSDAPVVKAAGKGYACELCDISCTSIEAYNAHTSGAKHQKVARLHQKLGKPVPNCEKPSQIKVVSAGGVKFKSGGQLDSATGVVVKNAADDDEVQNEAIGAEYIESLQTEDGKVVQYNCKICECKFNDINAKDMHIRGKRHRLSYKKKVNPEIKIDNKPNPKSKRAAEERMRALKRRSDSHWKMDDVWAMKEEMRKMEDELYARFGGGGRKAESFDDRHVLAKHQTIYPDESDLTAVQDLVTRVEKALKLISDKLFQEDKHKAEFEGVTTCDAPPQSQEAAAAAESKDDAAKFREVKGVMRIGILAKGLLLKGDRDVSLAVLCDKWPTKVLLGRIFKSMGSSLAEVAPPEDKYENCLRMDEGCIVVKCTKEPMVTLKILLTSPQCRTEVETELLAANEAAPGEEKSAEQRQLEKSRLNKDRCLNALAELRHCKWFEARASGLASCVIIVRIIYDLINRVPSWRPLPKWAAELIVEKALSCSPSSFLSPGDALRRVIETMASGVLLPGGCGLMDPCEREKCDAAASLTLQEREDITASAQHALRLITFKSIHKVLGIEQLANSSNAAAAPVRKRPAESSNAAAAGDSAAKITK